MSMLPVSGEQHEKAREAAMIALAGYLPEGGGVHAAGVARDVDDILAAYFASLAAQGVRLVDVSEVAEWLREVDPTPFSAKAWGPVAAIDFLRRFGGGDA